MAIDSYIYGANFTKAREDKGFSRQNLAHQLCCSKSQIQEIEEGGQTSFYNDSQKLIAAKKMAKFLAMNDDHAFALTPPDIKMELGIHQFNARENKPLPITNSSWRVLGVGAFVAAFCGYGIWNLYLANSHLYANKLIENKDLNMVNCQVESECALTSNAIKPSEEIVATTALVVDPCQLNYQNTSSFLPARADFAGNFIVFVSKEEQTVCVMDGKGEKQLVTIIPGINKVVSGFGPFTVIGQNLGQIDTYFQGWKVANITTQTDSIILKEAPVQRVVVNPTKEGLTSESKAVS